MRNILIFILIVISFLACDKILQKKQPKEEVIKTNTKTSISNTIEKKKEDIQYFTKKQIAKATISGIMGRPIKPIKVNESGDIFLVSYIRQDDNQLFSYKVKVDGNIIVWGSSDGRWRTHKFDSKIKYSSTKDKLIIIESFNDGSSSKYEYFKKDFN